MTILIPSSTFNLSLLLWIRILLVDHFLCLFIVIQILESVYHVKESPPGMFIGIALNFYPNLGRIGII